MEGNTTQDPERTAGTPPLGQGASAGSAGSGGSGGSGGAGATILQADVDALLNQAETGGDAYRAMLGLKDRLRKLQADFEASFTRDLLQESHLGRTLHLTLRVGPEVFAVPITQARRLVRGAEVVPLPGAPRHLLGVINLRGDLITVYDLPYMYGYPAAERAVANVVVMRGPSFDAGLAVTELGRLVALDEDRMGPPPGTLPAPLRQIVRGTCYEDRTLVLFPDLGQLFTQLNARS
jgi:purine-binding chemotaxis protein CheW